MARQEKEVKEIKIMAQKEKQHLEIQRAFLKLTNLTTWVEAKQRYPEETSSALIQFELLNFRKEIPHVCMYICKV